MDGRTDGRRRRRRRVEKAYMNEGLDKMSDFKLRS